MKRVTSVAAIGLALALAGNTTTVPTQQTLNRTGCNHHMTNTGSIMETATAAVKNADRACEQPAISVSTRNTARIDDWRERRLTT